MGLHCASHFQNPSKRGAFYCIDGCVAAVDWVELYGQKSLKVIKNPTRESGALR